MEFTLQQIIKACDGKLTGNPKTKIKGIAPYEEAETETLTFLIEEKYLKQKIKTNASAVVVKKGTPLEELATADKTPDIIEVSDPRVAMAEVLTLFEQALSLNKGVHKSAVVGRGAKVEGGAQVGPFVYIGEKAKICKNAKVYPGAYIGDRSVVGENSCVFPNASVYHDVKVGKNVRIHSGATIGVDGYGFAPGKDGYKKIPQIGGVIIEDNVEIFANVSIARGTIGNTVIKEGTKIDNLTHIAHNCKIGRHCAITGLVGFAGSVTMEDRVAVGGMSAFNGHITVGEGSIVMGRAGVTKSLPKNSVVSGFPAVEHAKDLQLQALQHRLPKLFQKIEVLEKRIKELEQK